MSNENPLYQNRTYRKLCTRESLTTFRATVKETDLAISACRDLTAEAVRAILDARTPLETWLETHPDFATSLVPVPVTGPAPALVRTMAEASQKAGVGPMAAVAGALSESVARALLPYSSEVIVENGGDTFIAVKGDTTVALHAGDSPFSMKVGLAFKDVQAPFAVCTSSGTVGHSLSFGKSDAVCVVSPSGALADAVATSIGNRVAGEKDIDGAVEFGKTIPGVEGLVVVAGSRIGFWGALDLVRL
ncbi:UPF0280 family protein [Desulfoluna butyratoxydans]|uniref:Apbe-like domain n=1 Tax=Desulfoluna butyratoxydans TaxID=231438 RepID=A0A4U8YUE5_9BACT|nr:UPF0280 family protein [Desulfoluna butyratoxydans]VFQ45512.1 apbe-like domain [Desulfoluna butyratoxydans]